MHSTTQTTSTTQATQPLQYNRGNNRRQHRHRGGRNYNGHRHRGPRSNRHHQGQDNGFFTPGMPGVVADMPVPKAEGLNHLTNSGQTPLYHACKNLDPVAARNLLQHGANPDVMVRTDMIMTPNHDTVCMPMIHYAMTVPTNIMAFDTFSFGNRLSEQEKMCKVTNKTTGKAKNMACRWVIVEDMIDHGASPNSLDHNGNTALAVMIQKNAPSELIEKCIKMVTKPSGAPKPEGAQSAEAEDKTEDPMPSGAEAMDTPPMQPPNSPDQGSADPRDVLDPIIEECTPEEVAKNLRLQTEAKIPQSDDEED